MSRLLISIISIGSLFCPTLINASVLLPPPTGPFSVSLDTFELIDTSRPDPWNSTHTRRLILSRFDPLSPHQCRRTCPIPYMPPGTATFQDAAYGDLGIPIPPGTFGSLHLQLCCDAKKPKPHPHADWSRSSHPVLLFSPGMGFSRLFYSATASQVASQGYTVLTIDHTYDADVVEFPDGTLVTSALPVNITEEAVQKAAAVRVADVLFILDTLSPHRSHAAKKGKVGVFGHSLGGAAAAAAMHVDKRIRAGVNLDGQMVGDVATAGLERPFLLWGAGGHNSSTDATWASFKGVMERRGEWVKELELVDSAHLTFTDLPVLRDVFGFADLLPPQFGALIGSLKGERVVQILGAYVAAFFDFALKGKREGLLAGPSGAYPEVLFID
ncbi:hypothetical protein H2201_003587 [Coniosporium apollinis]|uniref:1-alkyl-2-acetylglycerophosphocholine esterase n=1 Tax=Coniosporium apollinis TaxID=61459 RepID=A0ABQ9NVI4_9PEZI|nr:hypothetical protein H2201_003587 [Coniosporium apollinis]